MESPVDMFLNLNMEISTPYPMLKLVINIKFTTNQPQVNPNSFLNLKMESPPDQKYAFKLKDGVSTLKTVFLFSDPRATGEDCSVAPIFLPVTACHDFVEILLQSTKSLPVAYRHVGQFYVGYLKLADKNTS